MWRLILAALLHNQIWLNGANWTKIHKYPESSESNEANRFQQPNFAWIHTHYLKDPEIENILLVRQYGFIITCGTNQSINNVSGQG